MHSLPIFVRLRGETVLVIGEGEAAAAKKRLVERIGAAVTHDPAASTRFCFIALENKEEAAIAASLFKGRGMLVNVADQPALCDFTLPAIVDRDPVIIAIGTGGASAGLAKALRQRIEALLPATLGALASGLYAARSKIHARWSDSAARRRAIDAGLSEGGPLDPLHPHAAETLDQWLASDHRPTGEIVQLALTSDDPDDLTLKQARLMGQADALWYDPAIPSAILNRARADARRVESITAPPPHLTDDGSLILWLTRG